MPKSYIFHSRNDLCLEFTRQRFGLSLRHTVNGHYDNFVINVYYAIFSIIVDKFRIFNDFRRSIGKIYVYAFSKIYITGERDKNACREYGKKNSQNNNQPFYFGFWLV
jgi:hypothetical protein